MPLKRNAGATALLRTPTPKLANSCCNVTCTQLHACTDGADVEINVSGVGGDQCGGTACSNFNDTFVLALSLTGDDPNCSDQAILNFDALTKSLAFVMSKTGDAYLLQLTLGTNCGNGIYETTDCEDMSTFCAGEVVTLPYVSEAGDGTCDYPGATITVQLV